MERLQNEFKVVDESARKSKASMSEFTENCCQIARKNNSVNITYDNLKKAEPNLTIKKEAAE